MTEEVPYVVGRYAIFDEIAAGGMATVHIGRLVAPAGFSRTVAIKRLHPQFAKDPQFVSMFVDEARLAARIRHPNVVPTLDVVQTEDELFLVMEYVHGESLSWLLGRTRRRGILLEPRLVTAVLSGVLHGLHAAHNATGEHGEPLNVVHRDVSPQNVLVGTDGVARVFDFGIAKARVRLQTTQDGQIKGKLAYMAPEQLAGREIGPATDVYSAAVVLWEALAGRRLFDGANEAQLMGRVLAGATHPPSAFHPELPDGLDEIVMRGLRLQPSERFAAARAMAVALEQCVPCASATEVGEFVEELATETLLKRNKRVADIESKSEILSIGEEMISSSRHGVAMASPRPDSAGGQLSDLATPQGQVVSRRPVVRVVGWAAFVAIALFIVGGALLCWRYFAPRELSEQGQTEPTASHVVPTPAAMSTASTTVSTSASVTTSASTMASVSASATTSPSRPPTTPRRSLPPRTVRTASKATAPQCDPPYWVDAEGIRHPKPDCL